VCPQCGSAAAVHSIEEWAAMAQANTGHQWQSSVPMPGYPAGSGPQPGYGSAPQPGPAPQSGFPDPSQYQQPGFPDPSQYQQPGFPDPSQYQQPGFPDPSQYQQPGFPDPSQYQQPGFPDPSQYQQPGSPGRSPQPPAGPVDPQPTYQAGPQPSQQPGYQAGPPSSQQPGYQGGPPSAQPPAYQAGPQPDVLAGPESWQSQPRRSRSWDSGSGADIFEEAIGDAVLGAATKAIGRVIGRKMRQAYNDRIAPAMAARQEAVLSERAAIAQRHPDLRACLRDQVVFVAGGTRVLPLASAMQVRTAEQSDALVAQLRGG
jgi:hypothetical protein